MRIEYSYTAINVGFDLRVHADLITRLPKDATHIEFDAGDRTVLVDVSTPEDRSATIAAMRAAGYQVEDDVGGQS